MGFNRGVNPEDRFRRTIIIECTYGNSEILEAVERVIRAIDKLKIVGEQNDPVYVISPDELAEKK